MNQNQNHSDWTLLIESKQSLQKKLIKCLNDNEAFQYCTNQYCQQKNKFLCSNFKCECYKGHSNCLKASIQKALQSIQNKLPNNTRLKNRIDQVSEDWIQQISQFRDQLYSYIDSNDKFIGLTQIETEFYNLFVNNGKIEDFIGSKSYHLWRLINIKNQFTVEQRIQKDMKLFSKSFTRDYNLLKKQVFSRFDEPPLKFQVKKVVQNSSIIDCTSKYQKLTNFFYPKKVKQLILYYKASDYDFSTKQFYEQFRFQPNLIIVCLNSNHKIIGGYSSLSWQSQISTRSSSSSQALFGGQTLMNNIIFEQKDFLFSLTSNKKFPLQQKNDNNIRVANDKQTIRFAGNQFYISSNSNTQKSSAFSLGTNCRQNPKANQQIVGDQTQWFSVREWEAIKVEFYK